jgi:hypothetical protein
MASHRLRHLSQQEQYVRDYGLMKDIKDIKEIEVCLSTLTVC